MRRFVPYLFAGSKRGIDARQMGPRVRVDKRKGFPYIVLMIISKITSKAQTTIPKAVRAALRLSAGDELAYEIDGDRVIVSRARSDAFVGNMAIFTEWGEEADCRAYADF